MSRLRPALRLRVAALWMAAVAVVPAGLVFDDRLDTWRHGPPDDGEASVTSQPAAMTLVGHEVLGVETKTYPPGHAEAWEQDIGLHAVSVITGTLTSTVAEQHLRRTALARAMSPAGPRTEP